MENEDILNQPDPSGRLSKESWLKNNYPNLYCKIIDFCNLYNLIELPFKQKVYHYKYDIKELIKCQNPNCDKLVPFKNGTLGYSRYCSNYCIGTDPEIIKSKEQKSLQKYGTKTPAESKEIKEKTQEIYNSRTSEDKEKILNKRCETLLGRYGVDNPNKDPEIIKKRIKTFKKNGTWKNNFLKTMLEKYNVTSALQNEDIKQKVKNTNLERYGCENVQQNEEIRNKTYKTNLERYGNEITFLNREIKEKADKTILEKYGVKCVFQNDGIKDEIKEKQKVYYTKNMMLDDRFDIVNIDYDKKIKYIRCDCGQDHIFGIDYDILYNRYILKTVLCTICNPVNSSKSGIEIEFYKFIESIYDGNIVKNTRKIINGYELDVYIPDLNLAFEFNGVYWHNELNKSKDYHLIKTNLCLSNGIHLIHVYEDEWRYKQEIVKSRILNILKKTPQKIYARKCEVIELKFKDVKKFLDENHIQGSVVSSKNYGLIYDGELVSVMTFSKNRKFMNNKNVNESEYEMVRFCNMIYINVVGGASKLLNHFIKNETPSSIISYADRSWSSGNLYDKLGFEKLGYTECGYYYVVDGIRKHRYNYRKDILVKEGYDSNKTEHEIMLQRKIYRIYDSGSIKYQIKF